MACKGYLLGCTCSACQVRYIHEHANACSYGRPPASPRPPVKPSS